MILTKVHVVNGRKLVAICDEELIGKKFEENDLQLDLTGSFYKGEQVNEEELKKLLENAYVVNFAGKESVEFGIKNSFIKKENVLTVSGVPHAQAFVME
ncbi:hypothetical protein CMO88_03400 [Candidatus Woesearchaeota archaeon]|nr:hypothetical protein [Candidatus Woesearchaeota archaeon]|tara:strand:+ start:13513 stop:13809 length:297 start_codon:yes stop_codon:yes gene_type:complete